MTLLTKIAYMVRITGRVQGVCFRDWTRTKANSLKISGWVRNRQDGSVEAVISGYPDNIQKMLAAFEKGPNSARVISIQTNRCNPLEDSTFRQRPTV